jgi:hypothetical protein
VTFGTIGFSELQLWKSIFGSRKNEALEGNTGIFTDMNDPLMEIVEVTT